MGRIDKIIQDPILKDSIKLGSIFCAIATFVLNFALAVSKIDGYWGYGSILFLSGLMFIWVSMYFFSYSMGRYPEFITKILLVPIGFISVALWFFCYNYISQVEVPTFFFDSQRIFIDIMLTLGALSPIYKGYKDGQKEK